MNKIRRNKKAMLFFALPGLLLYTVFVVFPLIPEMLISFQKHNGIASSGFVGWKNYIDVLTMPRFWTANKNVLILLLITLFIGLPISFILAVIMDFQKGIFKKIFKTVCFIPAVLSVTIISQLWIAIYNPQWGLLNKCLELLHISHQMRAWLADEKTAIFCIAVVFTWQYIGFNMILFYAGLKAIPKTYFEAALIDGAGYVKSTIKVTLPLMQDIMKYVLTISLLGCIGMYLHVQMLTNGGPGDASMTTVFLMYNTAFDSGDFGHGCAIAILYILECILVSVVLNKAVAREKIEF